MLFVKEIKNGCQSVVEIRGTQGFSWLDTSVDEYKWCRCSMQNISCIIYISFTGREYRREKIYI